MPRDPQQWANVPVTGDDALFPGQYVGDPWFALNRQVWNAVADPAGIHRLPSLDDIGTSSKPLGSRDFHTLCAIWTSVMELMFLSLGWSHPGLGLAKWKIYNYQPLDRRLEVIAHLLGSDVDGRAMRCADHFFRGTDYYFFSDFVPHALVLRGPHDWFYADAFAGPLVDPAGPTLDTTNGNVYDMGSLHLPYHVNDFGGLSRMDHATRDDNFSLFVGEDAGSPYSASLVIDSYAGWYRRLIHVGELLERRNPEACWRVDVTCRPVGWLGRYTRDDVGTWYSGPSKFHWWGYPE